MRTTPAPAPIRAPAPAKTSPVKTPVKASALKPKLNRTHAAPAERAAAPVACFQGAAGRAWRMSGKHAVAYVHTAALAGELLETEPRRVASAAMAVYYDRKGRPFAWQFRFDAARWSEVVGRLA